MLPGVVTAARAADNAATKCAPPAALLLQLLDMLYALSMLLLFGYLSNYNRQAPEAAPTEASEARKALETSIVDPVDAAKGHGKLHLTLPPKHHKPRKCAYVTLLTK
jgi:hypothetical protein